MGRVARRAGRRRSHHERQSRSERPDDILDQIEAGVKQAGGRSLGSGKGPSASKACIREVEQAKGDRACARSCRPGDTIFIGARVTTTYQIVGPLYSVKYSLRPAGRQRVTLRVPTILIGFVTLAPDENRISGTSKIERKPIAFRLSTSGCRPSRRTGPFAGPQTCGPCLFYACLDLSSISSGRSDRGLSLVMTTTSARSAATLPIIGLFPVSRSPPQPNTAISLFFRHFAKTGEGLFHCVRGVGVIHNYLKAVPGRDYYPLEPAVHVRKRRIPSSTASGEIPSDTAADTAARCYRGSACPISGESTLIFLRCMDLCVDTPGG